MSLLDPNKKLPRAPPPPCWHSAAKCEHVNCGFYPDCACGDDIELQNRRGSTGDAATDSPK